MSDEQKEKEEPKKRKLADESLYRNLLAIGITAVSIIGVIVLAGTIVLATEPAERKDSAQLVLTGILPLLGAWVGTVLAYYFSKENFEAATRSVSEMSRRLTGDEALAKVAVKDVMIKRDAMLSFELPAKKLILTSILDEVDQAAKGSRIPILSAQGQPKYVIHRSVIDRYLVDKARTGASKADIEKLTLQDLFDDDPKREFALQKSFATVMEQDNLAAAKHALDQQTGNQDVFVTTTGKPDGTVVGWITNVIIAEHSQVTGR